MKWINVTPSKNAVKVDIVSDNTAIEFTTLSQYEIQRNNINGADFKSVKVVNWSTQMVRISSRTDTVLIPPLSIVVAPWAGDNGDIDFGLQWSDTKTHTILFYKTEKSSVYIPLPVLP